MRCEAVDRRCHLQNKRQISIPCGVSTSPVTVECARMAKVGGYRDMVFVPRGDENGKFCLDETGAAFTLSYQEPSISR